MSHIKKKIGIYSFCILASSAVLAEGSSVVYATKMKTPENNVSVNVSESNVSETVKYIDGKGQACKPFLLPQKDTDFYFRFMKSYNIPEFITGEVKRQGRTLAVKAKEDKGIDVRFK